MPTPDLRAHGRDLAHKPEPEPGVTPAVVLSFLLCWKPDTRGRVVSGWGVIEYLGLDLDDRGISGELLENLSIPP